MEVLFTRSNKIGSQLIRTVTGEDVSHCAIKIGSFVIHSTFTGVEIVPYRTFLEENEVVYTVHRIAHYRQIDVTLARFWGKYYDFGAFFYLGLRTLIPSLPKANLWQTTGMFLCTEFVTRAVWGREESTITPYQLYEKLRNS